MKAILVICALVVIAHGAAVNRIVGGNDATPDQFKHQASLQFIRSHFCGATVIGRRTLLTAAYCSMIYSAHYTTAVLGTNELRNHSGRRYQVKSFIIHEGYNNETITNDVAVVVLDEDIDFNDLVAALPLSSASPSDGERLTSSGWGWTRVPGIASDKLQWMEMNAMGSTECAKVTGEIVKGKICTLEKVGKGVCYGDIGGPLINAKGELVGITSAAYLCALGLPDFFTDVYYFRGWIEEHMV